MTFYSVVTQKQSKGMGGSWRWKQTGVWMGGDETECLPEWVEMHLDIGNGVSLEKVDKLLFRRYVGCRRRM